MDVKMAVLALRRPSNNDSERRYKLQLFSYMLTLVKNPQNIWVLVQEISLSPGLFTGGDLAGNCEYATDAVASAVYQKNRISDPTLSPENWEKCLIDAAYSVPPLIGLIITSALASLGKANYNTQVIAFANVVSVDPSLVGSVISCVSRTPLTLDQYSELPCDSMVVTLTRLIYTPANLDLNSPLMAAHLGAYSNLLKNLLIFSSVPILRDYLTAAQLFVRTLIAHNLPADEMKTFFFGVIMQLEGVCSQIIRSPFRVSESHVAKLQAEELRSGLAVEVLQILQPLGYVSNTVGTQFESYQFVFNSCLDTLCMGPAVKRHCGEALLALGQHWAYAQPLTASDAAAGDLVFLFEVAEQLIPALEPRDAELGVLSIARRFIVPPRHNTVDVFHTNVFEASHSVMLAFLATHHTSRFSKRNMAMDYFAEVMQLFPVFLNGTQLRTAVLTVLSSLEKPDVDNALEHVFTAAKRSMPGTMIPHADAEDKLNANPPTVRSALVSTLLHGVSRFYHNFELARWLELISPTLPSVYSEGTRVERQYMLKDFADVSTSGEDPAVLWWFKHYEGRL